jgi:hypothetical protein
MISPLDLGGIFADPFTFAEAIGLTAAVVLFLYFLFREVEKFSR